MRRRLSGRGPATAWAAALVLVIIAIPAGVLALQGDPTGFVEVCKVADGPSVSDVFRFTVAGVTIDVPVGACSPAIRVSAGTVTVTEAERAGISVSGVHTLPASRLAGVDLINRSAQIQVVAGDESTQTAVTFSNRAEVALLKICKVAGPGVAVGTNFSFTAGTVSVSVPAGSPPGGTCTIAGWFPVATNVAVTESVPFGLEVSAITVAPVDRLVGSANPAGGSVVVHILSGVTEATFTNREFVPGPVTTTTTIVANAVTTTTVPGGASTTTPGPLGPTTSTTAPGGAATTTTSPGGGVTTTVVAGGATTTTVPGGGGGPTTTIVAGGGGATTTTTSLGGGGGVTTTTSPGGSGATTTTSPGGAQATTTTTPGGGGPTTTTAAGVTTTVGPGAAPTTTRPGGAPGPSTTVGLVGQTTTTVCVEMASTTTTPTGGGGGVTTTTAPGAGGGGATTTTPGSGGGGATTTTSPGGGGAGVTTTTAPGGGGGVTTSTSPGGGGATTTAPAGGGSPTTTTTPTGGVSPTTTAPAGGVPVCTPLSPAPGPGPVPVVVRGPAGPTPSGSIIESLAKTGKATGRLVLIACALLFLGMLLTRPEPATGIAAAWPWVTTMIGRLPRRCDGRQPEPAPGDWEASGPDADPFPALTFVPVVVDEPVDTDPPMLVRGMVAPDTHPLRPRTGR